MVGDRESSAKKTKARKSRAGSAKGPLTSTREALKPKAKKKVTGASTKEARVHALPVRQATYSGVAIGKEHTEHPEVAFVGRSNVGKSSLLNAVVGQTKLARVSKTPGATRQIHLFRVELTDGTVWTIADLPGYGFAVRSKDERSQWADDIQKYFFERPNLRGVCVLIDARRVLGGEEEELFTFLRERSELAVLVVLTKSDKFSKAERGLLEQRFKKSVRYPLVATSAETGEGVAKLWRWVMQLAPVVAPRDELIPE